MSTIHITKSAAAVIVVSEEERRITVGIGMSHRERNCLSLIPTSSSVRVLPDPCLTVREHLSPRLRILTSVPSRVTARYPWRISLLEKLVKSFRKLINQKLSFNLNGTLGRPEIG